jgi:hypothetical protein
MFITFIREYTKKWFESFEELLFLVCETFRRPCDEWRVSDPSDDHQARKGRSHLGEDLTAKFISLKFVGK